MQKSISGVDGMIIPPPDMRAIIDKTAEFIAKQGKEMEKRIYTEDKSRVKFAFLGSDHPFHPYYEMALKAYKEGKTPEIPKPRVEKEEEKEAEPSEEQQEVTAVSSIQQRARSNPLAAVYQDIPNEEPPAYEFTQNVPELYSLEMDILRLTAQYTAINGRKFLDGIKNYQSLNPQFGFLKPTHILHGIFLAYIDQYTKIIHFDASIKDPLLNIYKHRETALRTSVHRMEFRRQQEEEERKQKQATEETLAAQEIDWGDFVVVQTITLDDDSTSKPRGTPLSAPLEQMEVDMEPADEPSAHETPSTAPSAATNPPSAASATPSLKVVDHFEPQLKSSETSGTKMMFDARTQRYVPTDQVNEHVRIEQLDPAWKKQQDIRRAREASTNLVDGQQMSETIHRMRAQRETELAAKRPQPATLPDSIRADDDDAIDQQLKRQRMKALEASAPAQSAPAQPVAAPSPAQPAPRPLFPGMPTPPAPPAQPSTPPAAPTSAGPSAGSTAPRPSLPSAMPSLPSAMPRPPMPPAMPSPMPPAMPAMMPRPPMPAMPSAMPGMPSAMPGMPAMMPMPGMMPMTPGMPAMGGLIPESQFVAAHPGPLTLTVKLPVDGSNPAWRLNGQSVAITIDVQATVKTLKQQIGDMQGGMPPSKQQLKHAVHGFLKDNFTMGYYNLISGSELQLTVRSRGGRK